MCWHSRLVLLSGTERSPLASKPADATGGLFSAIFVTSLPIARGGRRMQLLVAAEL
jgi:hypothetical protein